MTRRGQRGEWYRTERVRLALVLAAAVLHLLSCRDKGPSAPSQPEVSGDWVGSWTSLAFGGSAALRASFAQDGDRLDGLVVLVENLCVSSVSATGTIAGSRIALGIDGALGDRAELEGTIAAGGRTMSGTYRIDGGFCARAGGDRGTWTLARR